MKWLPIVIDKSNPVLSTSDMSPYHIIIRTLYKVMMVIKDHPGHQRCERLIFLSRSCSLTFYSFKSIFRPLFFLFFFSFWCRIHSHLYSHICLCASSTKQFTIYFHVYNIGIYLVLQAFGFLCVRLYIFCCGKKKRTHRTKISI